MSATRSAKGSADSMAATGASSTGSTVASNAASTPTTASKLTESILNTVLASALTVPPSQGAGAGAVSHAQGKQPLSIQVTTANFKKFVAKAGPIFWLSDQIEAVIQWHDREL